MNRHWIPWAVAVAAALALAARTLTHFYPAPPNPLTLELDIPPGEPGRSEPIVTTGRAGNGDFLFVRYVDATTIKFGYDSWGSGGPVSAPVKLAAGARHRLQIRMPALDDIDSRVRLPSPDQLRVLDNNTLLLDLKVQHCARDATAIWIGENPLGGSSCGPRFSGAIFRDGRTWRGGATEIFSWRDRLAGWFATCAWQVCGFALLGATIVRFWPAGTGPTPWRSAVATAWTACGRHRGFLGTAALCTGCFAWMVTGGSFQFNYPEGFGVFYDFQAASLLQGRLDVPESAISGEAFIYAGKYYGYFGVTPALLRLPFVIFDLGFGNLSRSFMLADYVACLVGAYLVLLAATETVRGPGARPTCWTTILLTLNVGLGSTIFFLASRAYIYHEAILCGVAFAMFASWTALRHLAAPERCWWLGSLVCGIFSVHARPPVGLFALTFLGCVALMLAWQERDRSVSRHLTIGLLCAVGVVSFNALSYLKFGSFDGAPLRLNVQYSAPRLARIEGRNFHFLNLRFNAYTYAVRPNVQLEPRFPWLYAGPSKPKPFFPEAKSDFSEPTVAFPFSMPVLFVFATIGCILAGLVAPAARRSAALNWFAVVPMAFAMFTAIATAHRYTADFCPFLITGAALGLAALECLALPWRAACRSTVMVTTLWAIVLTGALTLHYQGEIVWGVSDTVKQNYQRLRDHVDIFFGVAHRR